MPEQNVIFTEDRALQGYSSVVTCAIDGQVFHLFQITITPPFLNLR